MKRIPQLAAALVAILVLLPAAVGMLARPSFDALVQDIEDGHRSLGRVVPQSTDAGWFQTRRRVSVEIGDGALRGWLEAFLDDTDPAASLQLDLDIALRHGPLPLAAGRDGGWSPALANTRLTWSVRRGSAVAPLPAVLTLTSGPRTTDWHASIAPHEYTRNDGSELRVVHTGARIDGSFANNQSAFDAHGSLGDLTVHLDDGRWLGALGGALQLALHDGSATANAALQFAELQRGEGEHPPLRVLDVALNSDADVADRRLKIATALQTGEARKADSVRSMSAQARVLSETDRGASTLLARFIARAAGGNSIDDGPLLIGDLAARGVQLSVPEFTVDTPQGVVEAQMDSDLPAGDGDAREMLLRSSGDAQLKIPVKLLRMMMASSEDFEATMQYALQKQLVRRRGQQYVSNWRLRGGELRINGRPVPLPL